MKMNADEKKENSSGLKPMYSFDLWGVLIDQKILGQRKIDFYESNARKNRVPEHEIIGTVQDYRDLLDGKPWATGSRRSDIIDALEGQEWVMEVQTQFKSAFMPDALMVMDEILKAGARVLIFTSKPAPGLREQLASTLGRDIGEVRWGNKGDPEIFKNVYDLETKLGNRIVSHTADELPELVAASKSGLFPTEGLIYINRNESNSEEDVKKAGIGRYVNDLREVKYTTL